MNANDIAFGIEFETTLPANDDTPIGPYHGGWQVPWLGTGWKAERDGSIIPQTPNRKGCEFVSPKLVGAAGVAEVCEAIDKINARGGQVNHTCGLHITVTWNGDAVALARLITLVANHEKAIYASTGTRRREQPDWGRNNYCKPIKAYGNHHIAKHACDLDRYHMLNLTHLARGSNRIEFRAFAGTLNKEKVVGYIMMVLGLVELALDQTRSVGWSYDAKPGKPGPWERAAKGHGESEVNRLFYRLGWTKGHVKGGKKYGEVGTQDWKAIKAKLREMAEKYDRAAVAA